MSARSTFSLWFTLALVLAAPASANAAPVQIDLGPGVTSSTASGVNETGQIVGTRSSEGVARAFVWTPTGGAVDLGTLPGHSWSSASDINESGQIVGSSGPAPCDSGGPCRAFLRSPNGEMVDLGLPPNGISSYASALNNRGHVVGNFRFGGGNYSGFLWTPEHGMVDIGPSPGGVADINDSDQIVGYAGAPAAPPRAFLRTPAGERVDIGTLPGDTTSYANAINNSGQVVGTSYGSKRSRTFLWTQAAGMVDLGGLPGDRNSVASGITDRGEVVGVSELTDGNHLFSWTPAHGMIDLGLIGSGNDSGIDDVGDSGLVVGTYGQRAALWPPDTTAPSERLRLLHRQRIGTLMRRGLRLKLTLSEPGTAEITLKTRGSRFAGTLTIATKTVSFDTAGTKTVTLKLNHAAATHSARAKLRRLSRIKLAVRADASDLVRNASTKTSWLTLRR